MFSSPRSEKPVEWRPSIFSSTPDFWQSAVDMFLRSNNRKKDGKDHRYFSVVENHRVASHKTVQRTVLYLGEINDQQQAPWRKTLWVFDEQQQEYANLSLFPDDREIPADAVDTLQVKLSGLELRCPRLFGSCRKRLARLLRKLRAMRRNLPSRDQLLMRLGAAKAAAGRAFHFVHLQVPEEDQQLTRETFRFRVDKKKLQEAEWHDGHYLLRSNLTAGDHSVLWTRYVQLTQIVSVFRSLKSELGIRPIYHQLEHRADAHILIAFLAYCLQITLKQRLLLHAPGLTPTAVLEKLAEIQMVEVWIPMLDGRTLVLPRHTQPEPDVQALMEQVRITLPPQPPPRIKSSQLPGTATNQSTLLEGAAI